jgi:hypothetical protein
VEAVTVLADAWQLKKNEIMFSCAAVDAATCCSFSHQDCNQMFHPAMNERSGSPANCSAACCQDKENSSKSTAALLLAGANALTGACPVGCSHHW